MRNGEESFQLIYGKIDKNCGLCKLYRKLCVYGKCKKGYQFESFALSWQGIEKGVSLYQTGWSNEFSSFFHLNLKSNDFPI